MKVRCDKCHGFGTIEVGDPEVPCEASIVIGSETIGCFASRQHPEAPHMAILCQPCGDCGGYDECDDSCATYAAEPHRGDGSDWWGWNDGDLALTRGLVDGQDWRNRYQPTSPYARPVKEAS